MRIVKKYHNGLLRNRDTRTLFIGVEDGTVILSFMKMSGKIVRYQFFDKPEKFVGGIERLFNSTDWIHTERGGDDGLISSSEKRLSYGFELSWTGRERYSVIVKIWGQINNRADGSFTILNPCTISLPTKALRVLRHLFTQEYAA